MTDNVQVPIAAAAEELGIPLRTLRRHAANGVIKATLEPETRYSLNKVWRIPRAEVDRIKAEGINLDGSKP